MTQVELDSQNRRAEGTGASRKGAPAASGILVEESAKRTKQKQVELDSQNRRAEGTGAS